MIPFFCENEAAMRAIFNLVDSLGTDRVESIEVTGYSSPEGVYEYNLKVSLRRARSVAKILRARYAGMSHRVRVQAGGEAWPALRERVEADTRISKASQARVLRFLDDTSISDDTRKWRMVNWLKNDPNVGPLYPYLLRNHYRKLRSGVVVVIHEVPETPETPQTKQQPADTAVLLPAPGADTAVAAPALPPVDSAQFRLLDSVAVAAPADTLPTPDSLANAVLAPDSPDTTPADIYACHKGFIPAAGLSTNIPYDLTYVPGYGLTSIPSFSFEYYPASRGRWTYGLDVEWPMWKHWNSQRFMQINNLTLWTRRYFRDPGVRPQGAYALASVNAARYGIGFNQRGWLGEGLGASLGGGYKWQIGDSRFWFDTGAALGFFFSGYDPYVYGNDALGWYYYDYAGKPEDFQKRNNRWFWLGPTRIYFSVGVDLFNRNRRAKQ